MGIRLINYVNNQVSSPALYTGIFSVRPAAGIFGRLFMSIDTKEIYQDLTTSWQLLADAGSGSGTLETVTSNGNSTTYGISILSGNLSMTNAASSFNYKAITTGSILFSADSSGLISQNNANFFWDNTNNRLGIGTATPSAKLDIHSTGINATFNGTSTNNAYLVFQNAGTSKWYVGNLYSGAVANDFVIYDAVNAAYRLYVHNTGVVNIPTSLIIGSSTPTSIYALDVAGTGRFTANITGTTASFSGTITSTGSGASTPALTNTGAGTNLIYGFYNNTSGGLLWGVESSVGADIFGGSSAYSGVIGTNGNKSLQFATTNTIRTTITGGGNFLIGTTTDNGAKFQVSGTSTFSSTITGSSDIVLNAYSGYGSGSGNFYYNGTLNRIVFNEGISATTAAFIGVGVNSTPSTQGTSANYIQYKNTGGDFYLGQEGSTAGGFFTGSSAYASVLYSGTLQQFIINGTKRLEISTGGVVQIVNLSGTGSRAVLADASGNLSAPVSDLSVKQNVNTIGYGLNEIVKMNPVWFEYIDEYKNYGKGRQNGNIAQEMERIIPEAVFTTPSTNKMGINYDQLHAVYIKAIQELNEKLVRNNIN